MILFLLSLLAGVLTVLAPCTIALLPVIVGGSLSGERSIKRALVVTASLGVSVIAFTLLLKVSTVFVNVPQSFWQVLSGVIIIVLGITTIFPSLYDRLPLIGRMNRGSNRLLATGYQKHNFVGDILIGAALGPVFSSCSPTYFLILAAVLPSSVVLGLVYLLAYAVGLCGGLLVIAVAGQKLLNFFGVASDPHGWFKRAIGVLFVIVGLLILLGYNQNLELALSSHIFDVTTVEEQLLPSGTPTTGTNESPTTATAAGTTTGDTMMEDTTATDTMGAIATSGATAAANEAKPAAAMSDAARIAKKAAKYQKVPEITNPSGFINTDGKPIKISDFIGKKVILIDFWTYSCINCQRTLPYMRAWYDKYHDQGLEIISIHTPEFAFEHVLANVRAAVEKFGVKYPVVLDNDYGTWNAFGNRFWPRKYLIDIDGYIVYDHAGEGAYDETEMEIQKALKERDEVLGTKDTVSGMSSPTDVMAVDSSKVHSPETYFGAARNTYLGNGTAGKTGEQTLTAPDTASLNQLYLDGTWNFTNEYAEASAAAKIVYTYSAKNVYFVASAAKPVTVKVLLDGKPIPASEAGSDVAADGTMTISANRLYNIANGSDYGQHTLELQVEGAGLQAYTFTFG